MNKRLFRKLIKHPILYVKDSKWNPFTYAEKKIKTNQAKNIRTEAKPKLLNDNISISINTRRALDPLKALTFDVLIEGLNRHDVVGVYIKRKDLNKKGSICILEEDKYNFILSICKFSYAESFNISYKINGKVKKGNSVRDIFDDLSKLKCFDLRLSTNRTVKPEDGRLWVRVEFLKKIDNTYVFPVTNEISTKLWQPVAEQFALFADNLKDYSIVLPHRQENERQFDIDIVYTWVNSNDPDWKEIYKTYKPDFNSDATSDARFKSRDELKYSIRSWEMYGNFFRNIYIVSNCKPPEWLNLDNPRIKWVYHEDILPAEVLPTFSSHAIETSVHKIPGLSEFFIYCNDDVFLTKKTSFEDFFYSNKVSKIRLENWGNVNGDATIGDPDFLNAARNGRKLLEDTFKVSCTSLHSHTIFPMRKSIVEEICNKFKDSIENTFRQRFRSKTDVSLTSFLYPHYAYLTGNAVNSKDKVLLIKSTKDFVSIFSNLILEQKENSQSLPLTICINDGADSYKNEKWNLEVVKFLENYFSHKSSFEK